MDNYKPNSHKYKQEQQEAAEKGKVEKIVRGTVTTKKKNEIRKFTDIFTSNDRGAVKSYIVNDVLVPTFKDVLWAIITGSADIALFGGKKREHGRNSIASKVSYNKFYDTRRNEREPIDSVRVKSTYEYEDLEFSSRGDAEDVRDSLNELIREYGMASVGDLYDYAGVTGSFTDYKYGWEDYIRTDPVRLRSGKYILELPRVKPLNK